MLSLVRYCQRIIHATTSADCAMHVLLPGVCCSQLFDNNNRSSLFPYSFKTIQVNSTQSSFDSKIQPKTIDQRGKPFLRGRRLNSSVTRVFRTDSFLILSIISHLYPQYLQSRPTNTSVQQTNTTTDRILLNKCIGLARRV